MNKEILQITWICIQEQVEIYRKCWIKIKKILLIYFMNDFNKVSDQCNSIKLFNSTKIERILFVESLSKAYDFGILKFVTIYKDGITDKISQIKQF